MKERQQIEQRIILKAELDEINVNKYIQNNKDINMLWEQEIIKN